MQHRSHLLLLLFILMIFGGCSRESENTQDTKKQAGAPETIFVQTLEGDTYNLSELKGNVVVVDFWATWCKPCLGEIPEYNALYKKYAGDNVKMIGIAMASGSGESIKEHIKKYDVKYPIFNGYNTAPAYFGTIEAFPTTFVLDKNLNIREKIVGSRPGKRERIEELIAELSAETL